MSLAPGVPMGATYKHFVSRVDKDGNEVAGVRLPPVSVPLATLTGWAHRAPVFGGPGGCGGAGQTLDFAATKAEREASGDPRKSVEERYKTHGKYVAEVERAARKLVRQRLILQEDADACVSAAEASSVLRSADQWVPGMRLRVKPPLMQGGVYWCGSIAGVVWARWQWPCRQGQIPTSLRLDQKQSTPNLERRMTMHPFRNTTALMAVGLTLAVTGAVAKDSTVVVNVDNPDRSPYVESGSVTITAPFVNGFINFPTPPGRRYIIEQATVTCVTASNADVFTQVLLNVVKVPAPNVAQGIASAVVALEKRGPGPFSGFIWSGTANIKLITEAHPFNADGGGALFFNIFHNDFSVTTNCSASLFGHSLQL